MFRLFVHRRNSLWSLLTHLIELSSQESHKLLLVEDSCVVNILAHRDVFPETMLELGVLLFRKNFIKKHHRDCASDVASDMTRIDVVAQCRSEADSRVHSSVNIRHIMNSLIPERRTIDNLLDLSDCFFFDVACMNNCFCIFSVYRNHHINIHCQTQASHPRTLVPCAALYNQSGALSIVISSGMNLNVSPSVSMTIVMP